MNLRIVRYPHPALRCRAQPVQSIDQNVRQIARQMLELMYQAKGVGLAAPQVAIPFQLLVVNLEGSPEQRDAEQVLINPTITGKKGIEAGREGCLSFPGLFAEVKRAREITVAAYDLEGQEVELRVKGYPARVWQHEIDHLQGILFIDRLTAAGTLACKAEIKAFESAFRRAQSAGEIPSDAELERQLAEQTTFPALV
jgi:peptide deformylase